MTWATRRPLTRPASTPLGGARYLLAAQVPARLPGLVAFHSSAAAEACALGLADQLDEFEDERSLVRDLLWYADMTTGPDGQCVDFSARMDDVRARYAPDHYVVRALDVGMAERQGAMHRAEQWIRRVGAEAHV